MIWRAKKMDINFSEIEAYLLDYVEGRLSEQKARQVEEFLEKNPQYAQMLDCQEKLPLKEFLDDDDSVFLEKDSLKHTLEFDFQDVPYFDRLCVGDLEGVLTKDERKEKQRIIYENPELKRDVLLYEKTKLSADESIVFLKKETLKRRVLIPWVKILAVAAMISGLVLTFWLKSGNDFEISPVSFASHQVAQREISVAHETLETESLETKPLENKTLENKTLKNNTVKNQEPQNLVSCYTEKIDDGTKVNDIFQEDEIGQEGNFVSVDFSKIRIEQKEFSEVDENIKNYAADEDFYDDISWNEIIKPDFIGSKIYRLKRKFRVELTRGNDGRFKTLTIVTSDKTYCLSKRDKLFR